MTPSQKMPFAEKRACPEYGYLPTQLTSDMDERTL